MEQNRTLSSNMPLILGGGIALLGCILLGGTLFFALRPQGKQVAEAPTATRVSSFPTATIAPSATASPTHTLTPTSTTPPSTNTAEPTTAAPTVEIQPTAVPTDTEVPPPVEPPGQAHGLRVDYFRPLKTSFAAGEDIGFEFLITNISSDAVGWGLLGADFADANGTKIFYQASYAGGIGGEPKYWLQPGQALGWQDYWRGGIATPGTYQTRLLICYDSIPECDTPSGDWEILSPFTQITIN